MGILFAAGLAALLFALPDAPREPRVEAEELVYNFQNAANGAGPMWCYGSTCIVRIGGDVFVSGLETLPDVKPLNNTRWVLFRRGANGWELIRKDQTRRTREPCPIAATGDGSLYLSANPTLTPPGTYNGPSRPEVLRFDSRHPSRMPEALLPKWEGSPAFTEHSYRGLCADAARREVLLMNILGHEAQYWSLLDRNGRWVATGRFEFPMGLEYEKPEPIRLCYPVLALKDRAAHVLAISDIVEPVRAWREFKRQLTGQEWDYEFRRLFYAWSPDIGKRTFGPAVEIASREKTCGHITNLDIWLERPDRAHLLWLERSIWHPQMRDRFFPGTPITVSLEHAVVERGRVVSRTTLAKGGEGAGGVSPGYGRFHASPGGRLYVLAYFGGTDPEGKSVSENRLLELDQTGAVRRSWRVPLMKPFPSFMTATERAGSPRSDMVDILGPAAGRDGISYARVRLP